MMLTDRELLEAAAKAAGLNGKTDRQGFFRIESENGLWPMWNPLTDDGDALRLAVKLKLEIAPGDGCAFAHDGVPPTVCIREDGEDVGAATRRAIVRAAAAMTHDEFVLAFPGRFEDEEVERAAAMASPDRLGA